jgi:hypothetical protein
MYRKLLLACLALFLFTVVNVQLASANTAPQSCTGNFQATITRGPDTGTVLAGRITLTVDEDGDITGALVQNDNSSVKVGGIFRSPIIGLEIRTSTGIIIGVGRLPGGFTPCTSNFGGNFIGPKLLDRGDWGIIWGS